MDDVNIPADPSSTPSPSIRCSTCGHEIQIGDFPWCPHESIYSRSALPFAPIVLFQSASGEYRFPGSSDARPPAGFQRVEITSLAHADRITREINSQENAKIREQWHRERARSESLLKERRADLKEKLKKMSPQARAYAERAMAFMDRKRSRKLGPSDANFHMDVIANDSSNREQHRDSRTDWRGRKG